MNINNMTDELQRLYVEGGSPTRIKYLQNKIKRATIVDIRKRLKERGVRFNEFKLMTQWAGVFGENVEAYPIDRLPDKLYVKHMYLTPEEAIAATLGTETCQLTDSGTLFYPYECSECGAAFDIDEFDCEVNFCPNCGRRIEVTNGRK